MPSVKISALSTGAPAQKSDLHVLARSGANYKITSEELFSETITLANFATKSAAGNLIPGRWYRVTGANGGDAIVLAATNSTHHTTGYFDTLAPGIVLWANWGNGLSSLPLTIWDDYGQELHGWQGATNWPVNSIGYFQNNVVKSVNYNFTGLTAGAFYVWNSEILNGAISHNLLTLERCKVVNSFVYSNAEAIKPLSFDACTFLEATVLDTDQQGGAFYNCHFENVLVEIKNSPTVTGLKIYGTTSVGGPLTTYIIDGAYQNQVQNQWSGIVVADPTHGYSTVRMSMSWDTTENDGTINADTATVHFLPASPVGVYTIDTAFTGSDNYAGGDPFDLQYCTGILNHPVKLEVNVADINCLPSFVFNTSQNVGSTSEVVQYHGITTKVHQLFNTGNFLEICQRLNYNSVPVYFLQYGAHYDI